MALVAPLLTSAMPITRVNRSAVNGVVNAVTGRNKDNNAPVPVEETQEVGASGEGDVQNADKGISECQIFFDSFKRCQERVKMENMNRFE